MYFIAYCHFLDKESEKYAAPESFAALAIAPFIRLNFALSTIRRSEAERKPKLFFTVCG
jgi:hypothetical protein